MYEYTTFLSLEEVSVMCNSEVMFALSVALYRRETGEITSEVDYNFTDSAQKLRVIGLLALALLSASRGTTLYAWVDEFVDKFQHKLRAAHLAETAREHLKRPRDKGQ